MKNKKMKSMLLGLAGATIMTNAFAAAPTIIDPSTTLDVVNGEKGNIIISDAYRYVEDFNGTVGKEDGLVVTKFIGNTKADSKDKVYILDGDVKIANLADTLNGSKLEKVNGEIQKVNQKSVVLSKDGMLETTAKELFSNDKNDINDKVAPYLDLHSGYVALEESVSKKDALKYRDVLGKSKSDTGIIVKGKLLDEKNNEIKSQSIKDAIDMANKKVYSLSTTVEIQGKDVNKVVFTDDKKAVEIKDNTMFIPKAIFAKSINLDKGITELEINHIREDRPESIKDIYEASGYKYDDMHAGDCIILGNAEKGGKAIAGGDKLVITINNDTALGFVQGPTNTVDANIQVSHGHIDVDGATATFKKEVMINEKELTDNIEEQGNVVLNDAKMVLDDELWLRPGTMYTENSVLEANNKVNVDLKGSKALLVNSKADIDQLLLFDGGAVVTKDSEINIKELGTDDRFSHNEKFNRYLNATKQENKAEEVKKSIADESTVDFIDSNVNIKDMGIEGRGKVTFINDKNDKNYNVDVMRVYRGGQVELKGGTLKVNEFLGSSYIEPDEGIVEGALDGTYNPEGKIILSGGVLEANNLRGLLTGELISDKTVKDSDIKPEELADFKNAIIKDKPVIELKGNARIKTKTDQIFANGAGEKIVDAGDVANKAIDYEAGILEFNDAKYTRDYLKTARTNLAKEHDNKSTTKILMTGDEIDLKGNVVENITLEEALENSNATDDANNVVINNKTIVLPENKVADKLVIGTVGDEPKDKVVEADKDLQGPDIDASQMENLKEIVVNNDRKFNLGGKNKELISGLKEGQELTYTVEKNGTLTFGNSDLTKKKDDIKVDHITVANEGKLEVDQANLEVKGKFITNDVATIEVYNDGKLTLDNTKAKPEDEDKVTISKDTTIYVGDNESNGNLELKNVSLNGAKVLIDPQWGNEFYSSVSVKDEKGCILDGKYVVGRNSVLTVNALDVDEDNIHTHEGKNEAVLAVYSAIKLDEQNGSIVVNPKFILEDGETDIDHADTPENTITFADNTQFITGADSIYKAAENDVAILNAKTINLPKVDEKAKDNYGAQALVTGNIADYVELGATADKGKSLYLAKAEDDIENNFKNVAFNMGDMINLKAELSKDKKAIELVRKDKDNKSIFNKVKKAFPNEKIILGNAIDNTLEQFVKDVQAGKKEFNNELLGYVNNALANENRVTVLNSMANMADLGGVTKESYANLDKFADTVEEFHKENELWATYTHSNNNSDVELTGNKASYSAKGNGLVMGGALAKNDHKNLGMAVFYNKGKVTANSGVQTKNDVKSYGIGFYQTNKLAKGELVSQIAYSHNANDLAQFNGMDVKAKANTSNYSLAVKYEQAMAKANGTVTPFVGLRFAHLGGASFTNSLGFNYDVAASNVVSMPLGVKYAGNIQKGKATIAPFAELGYTPVLSGKNHNVKVGLNAAADSFTNTVLDNTWHAKLGANITKGNNTFGLSYGHYQGKQTKDNQIMANMELKF